jgi:acetyl-CoA C-acetyltransferase
MMDALIFDAVRTPRGKGRAGGSLSELRPIELVEHLVKALGARHEGVGEHIEQFVLGCVTQTGEQGADLAKIAALYAGLPHGVMGTTINTFCTSGLDAVGIAAAKASCGIGELAMAGGVESMSRVPIFSDKGPWFADREVAKRTKFVQMGFAADLVASLEGFARGELDEIAARSHQRAAHAQSEGYFEKSLVPVTREDQVIEHDELVRPLTTVAGISTFDALFADERSEKMALELYPEVGKMRHVHHRANSPSLADGAGLVIVGTKAAGEQAGLTPRARIRSFANASVEPMVMLTAAQDAAQIAMEKAGVTLADVDLIELNEAFASVVLKFLRDLEVSEDKVNVNGGTIAAGHAMGATGAILISVLLDELERQDKSIGLVAVSGGAGLGSAMVVERI